LIRKEGRYERFDKKCVIRKSGYESVDMNVWIKKIDKKLYVKHVWIRMCGYERVDTE